MEIDPVDINDTESRIHTLLFTLLKHKEGLSLDEIRSLMPRHYDNPNKDSDQRKLRRDLESLKDLGFRSIYNSTTNKYHLMDQFSETSISFAEEELKEISLAILDYSQAQGFSPEIYILSQKLFGKLWDLYPYFPATREEIEFRNSGDLSNMELILDAISAKRMVSFQYERTYGKTTNREVDPIQIIRKYSQDFYLYAYDRNAETYRTFLVPCIRNVSVSSIPHTKKHPPLKDLSSLHPLRFQETEEIECKIEMEPTGITGFYSFLDPQFSYIQENQVILRTTNPSTLYPLLFRFHKFLIHLEPEKICVGYQNFLQKILTYHSNLSPS